MNMAASTGGEHLILGLITVGAGFILYWTDRRSETSRALAVCLMLIGGRLLFEPLQRSVLLAPWWSVLVGRLIEAGSILAGIEWARRIGRTATQSMRRTVHWLFRASQILVLIYAAMQLGYLLLAPDAATTDVDGLIRVRGYEWALFAPILGTGALLSGIAILILLIVRTDPAESVRLRALLFSSPLLLSGLVLSDPWVPLALTLGLLVFLAGTIRYLIVQSQRANSMRRFLSPELWRLINVQGMDQALRREKRTISAVVCDMRGFTAFARQHDSETVVALLERYYEVVGEVATTHGGTVKDHAGDGVLILVGAPVPRRGHARRAMALSQDLVRRVASLIESQDAALGIGVGVATGEVTVGAIHGGGRLEYVAVGNAVNLAARLCQRAEHGQVLVDCATLDACAESDRPEGLSPHSPEVLKGYDQPVDVHALGVLASAQATIRQA